MQPSRDNKTKPRVALTSFPATSPAPYKFLSDIALILDPISDHVFIIDGDTERITYSSKKVTLVDIGMIMHNVGDVRPTFYSVALWIAKSILAQLKLSFALIRLRNDVDVVFFYAAAPHHLLPLVTAKILRKRAVEVISVGKSPTPMGKILDLQLPLFFRLLDGISPLTQTIIDIHGLNKYANKLLPEGFQHIDTSRFAVTRQLAERSTIVGFVSRLRKEKGIVEFVKAIPLILQDNPDSRFLIGGSGDLAGWVAEECQRIREASGADITITGWIGEDLPTYLNQLKLLVLPTWAEALGAILVEAMACGTPVLVHAVGGVRDIVKDGETGFLLANTEPQSIADKVTEICGYSDEEMAKVVCNGIALVNERFSYAAAVERYKGIIAAPA